MIKNKIILQELERKYQEAMSTHPSVEELFAMDRNYYAYLKEEIEQNPKNVHALIHLGVLSWEPFHKQEEAIKYLEKAIERSAKTQSRSFRGGLKLPN